MDLTVTGNTVTIRGNIKSVSDFQAIKSAIDPLVVANDTITIVIPESISMTSSIIGYLNKLVLKDGARIEMRVGTQELYDLLDDLNLIETFHVRKV